MNNISSQLLKGGTWVTMSRLIVNGLGALSTFVLAWELSPADFGLVAIGTTVLAILTSFTEISLTEALIQLKSPTDAHLSSAWTLNALRSTLLCLITWLFAWPVAQLMGDPRLFAVLLAMGATLFISGLASPRLAMAQRDLVFWQDFTVSVGQKFAGFAFAVALAILLHSYWALVIGAAVSQVANVAVSYVVAPFRPRVLFKHARELFSFSGWLSASQVINTLNWRFDQLLVGKLLSSSALGFYSMGSNLALMPTRETTAPLMLTIYPGFAIIRGDNRRLRAAYQRAQALLTAVALPAGVGMASIADPLVSLTLGAKWAPVVFIIQALAAVYAAQTFGSLAQPLGMAQGQTRTLFIRDVQMLTIRVPILAVSALYCGLNGVILGRVFTGLLASFVNMLLVRKFIQLSLADQLRKNVRTLVSCSFMFMTVNAAQHLFPKDISKLFLAAELLVLAAIGAAVYIVTTALLWVASGKPVGAEAEIVQLLLKFRQKVYRPRVIEEV